MSPNEVQLLELNRRMREEIAACRMALEAALPMVRAWLVIQSSVQSPDRARSSAATLDLIEAALNWRTTEPAVDALPSAVGEPGPPASPSPDTPGKAPLPGASHGP